MSDSPPFEDASRGGFFARLIIRMKSAPRWRVIGWGAATFAICALLARTAWISDDAYITLRTVSNVLDGYGLRWNVAERVQSYTHPLWCFLLIPLHAATDHAGVSLMLLAGGLAIGHLWLLGFRIARSPLGLATGVCALMGSRAFIDYSTSGLENPLTFLIIALFVALWRREERGATTPLWGFSILVGLGMLNRMDTLLLFAPAMLWILWERGWTRRHVLEAASGAAIIFGWMAFSLIYYGFPFPNTAYAKIGTGIGRTEMAAQGLAYLRHSLAHDPVTLGVTGATIAGVWLWGEAKHRALAAGALIYILYVIWIGGDFMAGRFLAAPLFLSACILAARLETPPFRLWTLPPAILAISLLGVYPNLVPAPQYPFDREQIYDEDGIADERKFYFRGTSPWFADSLRTWPEHGWGHAGRRMRERGEHVEVHGNVGFRGYFAGPQVTLVDPLALTDPLLARLPAIYAKDWRIGHFRRHIPPGYIKTLKTGEPHIEDEDLATLYAHIERITRGPLWDAARWRSIWLANTGGLDHLIPTAEYQYAGTHKVRPEQWDTRREDGTRWNDKTVILRDRGACVTYEIPRKAKRLEISTDANDSYEITVLYEDTVLHQLVRPPLNKGGLRAHTFDLSEEATTLGVDRVCVFPGVGDGSYSVGHVLFEPAEAKAK